MSIIRNLVKQVKKKSGSITVYNSHNNYLFYGSFGKSTVSAALSNFTEEPVLLISPAGGSTYLEADYPNIITYPVANLTELQTILDDLEKNMLSIRKLNIAINSNDQTTINNAKTYYEKSGENWDYIYDLAKNNKMPVSAVVLEELSIVSSWCQDKLEDEIGKTIGEDKTDMGRGWNMLKRELLNIFTKVLRYPCTTILCTSDKMPSEQQGLKQIVPNICNGSAQRIIIETIGNCFYFHRDDEGKYKIRIKNSKNIFAKDKILSPHSKQILPEEIDVSKNPELFWQMLNELKQKDILDREKSKGENYE